MTIESVKNEARLAFITAVFPFWNMCQGWGTRCSLNVPRWPLTLASCRVRERGAPSIDGRGRIPRTWADSPELCSETMSGRLPAHENRFPTSSSINHQDMPRATWRILWPSRPPARARGGEWQGLDPRFLPRGTHLFIFLGRPAWP